jgi:hypothetical protein
VSDILGGFDLGSALHKLGMIPSECTNVELLAPVDGVLQLRLTVNVHPMQLLLFAKAFHAMAVEYDKRNGSGSQDAESGS